MRRMMMEIIHCIASKINNNRIVAMLLTHGADPNACDKHNKTPLYYLSGTDDEVIERINLLVQYGAKINNSVDEEGCGPLLACTDPSERVFKNNVHRIRSQDSG